MTSRMTAMDELRRLLDERGVEYTFIPGDEYSREHIKIGSTEILTNGRDEVAVYFITPEQAIEATLGRSGCVYVLTAIDPGDGREYTLGIYATKELAEKSAETDGRGYVLHDVSRWEVVDA